MYRWCWDKGVLGFVIWTGTCWSCIDEQVCCLNEQVFLHLLKLYLTEPDYDWLGVSAPRVTSSTVIVFPDLSAAVHLLSHHSSHFDMIKASVSRPSVEGGPPVPQVGERTFEWCLRRGTSSKTINVLVRPCFSPAIVQESWISVLKFIEICWVIITSLWTLVSHSASDHLVKPLELRGMGCFSFCWLL